MPDIEGEATRPRSPQGDASSLERPLRTNTGALETSLPSLVNRAAIREPGFLTRNGFDAFVSLPLNAHDRLWARVPRSPVFAAQSDPDS